MNIYSARHGETTLNKEHKLRGWEDVNLDSNGKEQAEKMGNELQGQKISKIYSSDLKRAKETSDIISKKIDAPVVEVSKDLRPWNLGNLNGASISETLASLHTYIEKLPNKALPGGESFNDFKNRFLPKLIDIIKDNQGKNVAVVAHHRNERLTEAWIKGGMQDDLSIKTEEMKKEGAKPGTFVKHKIING